MLVDGVLIPKPSDLGSVSLLLALTLLSPFTGLQSFWLPCLVLMPIVGMWLEGRRSPGGDQHVLHAAGTGVLLRKSLVRGSSA